MHRARSHNHTGLYTTVPVSPGKVELQVQLVMFDDLVYTTQLEFRFLSCTSCLLIDTNVTCYHCCKTAPITPE